MFLSPLFLQRYRSSFTHIFVTSLPVSENKFVKKPTCSLSGFGDLFCFFSVYPLSVTPPILILQSEKWLSNNGSALLRPVHHSLLVPCLPTCCPHVSTCPSSHYLRLGEGTAFPGNSPSWTHLHWDWVRHKDAVSLTLWAHTTCSQHLSLDTVIIYFSHAS